MCYIMILYLYSKGDGFVDPLPRSCRYITVRAPLRYGKCVWISLYLVDVDLN